MGQVTIPASPPGNTYQIYGDQAGSIVYLTGSIAPAPASYLAATADQQAKALVTATRLLDRQKWMGLPVGTPAIDVTLQWPRTGVSDSDGNVVSSASVPDQVVKACYELAALLLVRPGIQDQANADPLVAATSGGGTSVTLFKQVSIGRFPKVVQEYVGQFLRSVTFDQGSIASGTNDSNSGDGTFESQFDDPDRYGLSRSL